MLTPEQREDRMIMTFPEFVRAIKDGVFTDDDGYAILFSITSKWGGEIIRLSPSELKDLHIEWVGK